MWYQKDIHDQIGNAATSLPTSPIKILPIGFQDFSYCSNLKIMCISILFLFFAYCCVVILSSVVTSMNIR